MSEATESYNKKMCVLYADVLTIDQWLWLLANANDIDYVINGRVIHLARWAFNAINEI